MKQICPTDLYVILSLTYTGEKKPETGRHPNLYGVHSSSNTHQTPSVPVELAPSKSHLQRFE